MDCVDRRCCVIGVVLICLIGASAGRAQDASDDRARRQSLLDGYAAAAKAADPGFAGFDPTAGRAFYLASPGTGSPETPSCTTCHTNDPHQPGHTRAGKEIAPVAVSITPSRFTDPVKVERWFGRNCRGVYGRDCTAREKGDYISFMATQ